MKNLLLLELAESLKALPSFTPYVFLFLWVKYVKVEYTENVPFEQKIGNRYKKLFGFFPLNNSLDVLFYFNFYVQRQPTYNLWWLIYGLE